MLDLEGVALFLTVRRVGGNEHGRARTIEPIDGAKELIAGGFMRGFVQVSNQPDDTVGLTRGEDERIQDRADGVHLIHLGLAGKERLQGIKDNELGAIAGDGLGNYGAIGEHDLVQVALPIRFVLREKNVGTVGIEIYKPGEIGVVGRILANEKQSIARLPHAVLADNSKGPSTAGERSRHGTSKIAFARAGIST